MGSLASKVSNLMGKAIGKAHSSVYRASDGRVWGKMLGGPVLLLNTTGRKSGQRRTTPLLYVVDGENFVVIASNGGAPVHPAWYLNLTSNPDATVEIEDREVRVRAEEAHQEEKARLWRKMVEMYPPYDDYQKKTEREIPLIVLHPLE
ncbi:MAG: nitroreductase family deazaflavin-dependent oxidoreductase [Actinomycetota bacterium]|nr:nitroreductase family deazaflavin-dependent oxidoreductase [Actinomycetota bacterium]